MFSQLYIYQVLEFVAFSLVNRLEFYSVATTTSTYDMEKVAFESVLFHTIVIFEKKLHAYPTSVSSSEYPPCTVCDTTILFFHHRALILYFSSANSPR